MALGGMAILVYRRRTVGPVFSATTVMDKVMYAFLGTAIVLGMWNTIAGSILSVGGHYDYREGVSVWYRSFLAFNPDPALMAEAPLGLPAARAGGLRPVRALAVHPARARLLRAGGLPDPALYRLPLARRTRGHGGRQPIPEPRLGATMSDEITDLQKAGEELLRTGPRVLRRPVLASGGPRRTHARRADGPGQRHRPRGARCAGCGHLPGRLRACPADRRRPGLGGPGGCGWCRSRRSGTAWRPTRTR